ncbi:hypothetical protein KW797_04335, partial [Candidatus Parcubacteria bacterium]|nr:hypothetical protein [Candidatus Parcubacteria bacterium]
GKIEFGSNWNSSFNVKPGETALLRFFFSGPFQKLGTIKVRFLGLDVGGVSSGNRIPVQGFPLETGNITVQ